jgi:hypothetical protein
LKLIPGKFLIFLQQQKRMEQALLSAHSTSIVWGSGKGNCCFEATDCRKRILKLQLNFSGAEFEIVSASLAAKSPK